ncbi:MAG: bifunctional demethylmenaquinone methyltransferase/2-methoxy-6-polyprenyl-1,4-benzoquinol methylase UbiE [bacterium]
MNNRSEYVRNLFSSIAPTYDFLNTFLSFNQDKRWRTRVIREAQVPESGIVLDLCTGTGKLVFAFQEKSPAKLVVGLDFSFEMLAVAQTMQSLISNLESRNKVSFIQADAIEIPFQDNTFDCITIAFGIRNIPDLTKLFQEMLRVTKPGGKMIALELTRPQNKIVYLFYYLYLHLYLPILGRLVSKNKTAYTYLATTISQFYDREQIKQFMHDSGWQQVNNIQLTLGITTIYVGVK